MRLTTNFLLRHIAKRKQQQDRKKGESDVDYLKKLTHLRLQGRYLQALGPVEGCGAVVVVYLQNNLIETIENLEGFPSLQHLYLQRNKIQRIDNLEKVEGLRKLYLGYNQISVLEGLESSHCLLELHVEHQRLAPGDTLHLDPRSMRSLGPNLRILNISGNRLESLKGLTGLFRLEVLDAKDNALSELEDVCMSLSELPMLHTLNLTDNPVTFLHRYRDHVIMAAVSLTTLDAKTISPINRMFVENLAKAKLAPTRQNKSAPEIHVDALSLAAMTALGSKLFPAWKQYTDKHPAAQRRAVPRDKPNPPDSPTLKPGKGGVTVRNVHFSR